MFTSKLALPAAWLLLLGAASAVPAPDKVAVRQAANPTDAWVTVDESGVPKTITPVMTTIDGVPTLLNAAPRDVTVKTTSVGAAQPRPTDDKGASDLEACSNANGEFHPFCLPKHNDVYYPGSTHYVTWDPAFFGSNATLKVLGYYTTNETTIAPTGPPTGKEEEAFSSDNIEAGWGFYQWHLPKSLLTTPSLSAANITLRIVALPKDGKQAQWLTGPTITLRYKPAKPKKKPAPKHDDQALYIALPLVFGVAALMIVGTFFWNRQVRAIGVGNIMSRARREARRKGVSKKDRVRNRDKEQGIRLMGASDEERTADWEEGWRQEVPGGSRNVGSGKRAFDRADAKRMD